MSSRDGECYYWLKLHKDFFKRHDICLLEAGLGGRDPLPAGRGEAHGERDVSGQTQAGSERRAPIPLRGG